MTEPKLAYILGNPASGKGALRGLLDGHPALAVSPVQHMLIKAFTGYSTEDELRDPGHQELFDILTFRRRLAKTGYYKLQANQEGSPRTATTTSLQNSPTEKYQALEGFDFYEFEKAWITKLNQNKIFHPKDVFITIFQTFFDQWESYTVDWDTCEYILGYGINKTQTVDYLLREYDDSKIIVVNRDPRGIIAARGKAGSSDIDSKLSSGKVYRFIEYTEYIDKVQRKFDDRVLTVNFRDLILNKEQTIQEVTDFLDIEPDKILEDSTLAQKELDSKSDQSRLGQINDDWRELLTDSEKRIIGLQMGEESMRNCTIDEINMYLQSVPQYRLSPYMRLMKQGISELRSI